MSADLHLHSHFSDGTFSPEEIVGRASELGIRALALTDHDTVNGWDDMKEHCGRAGIHWVPGIELSTRFGQDEVHLLGYFPDKDLDFLPKKLTEFQARRQDRVLKMVQCLTDHGIDWDAEAVAAEIQCEAPGRPHVARALVKHGVVSNVSNAFRKYLREGKPGWVPSVYPTTGEMIRAIHKDHGLAVLAHPGLSVPNEVIVELSSQGLDGLEVFHTAHKPSLVKKYLHYAQKFRLLITGGSDCHGHISGGPRMGKSVLPVEYFELFEKALREKEHRQAAATCVI